MEEHGADTNMPMAWVMCDMVEFAAGKGHLRVLKYLLEKTTVDKFNARAGSNFSLITAVDRAAKAGHLECLKAIKEFGGIIDRRHVITYFSRYSVYVQCEVFAILTRSVGSLTAGGAMG